MSAQPTASFLVTVHAHRDDSPGVTAERVVPIPPDYNDADLRQFYGVVVQDAVRDMLAEAGWRFPLRRALLINAARMLLIERLVDGEPSPLAEAVRRIILMDDDDALAEGGDSDVEG